MSLALCTTMRGCEIKRLQWRDIDFLNGTLLVRTSKTEAGERVIPMNDEPQEAVRNPPERARSFNGTDAEHYIFPALSEGKEAGCDINNDTKHNEGRKTVSEVIENVVGPCGLEPPCQL